jgi:hypothetical protein
MFAWAVAAAAEVRPNGRLLAPPGEQGRRGAAAAALCRPRPAERAVGASEAGWRAEERFMPNASHKPAWKPEARAEGMRVASWCWRCFPSARASGFPESVPLSAASKPAIKDRIGIGPELPHRRTSAVAVSGAGLADCGTSLPPQDAATADRRKPRLCRGFACGLRIDRSAKWTKAMDGFVHGQLDLERRLGAAGGVAGQGRAHGAGDELLHLRG